MFINHSLPFTHPAAAIPWSQAATQQDLRVHPLRQVVKDLRGLGPPPAFALNPWILGIKTGISPSKL